MTQILIIHGYRGPATGGEYWLPNTVHDVSPEAAAYLIDGGHARELPPPSRAASTPVEVVAPDEPDAEQPEQKRTRRGGR